MKKENKCTRPNCDCAEKEMIKQGTEFIKSYPCLASHNFDELKSEFKKTESKEVESVPVNSAEEILENVFPITLGIVGIGWHQIDHEQKQDFIDAMETYALQFKTNPIEVIKKRVEELDLEIKSAVWPISIAELKGELKGLLNILKLIQ